MVIKLSYNPLVTSKKVTIWKIVNRDGLILFTRLKKPAASELKLIKKTCGDVTLQVESCIYDCDTYDFLKIAKKR